VFVIIGWKSLQGTNTHICKLRVKSFIRLTRGVNVIKHLFSVILDFHTNLEGLLDIAGNTVAYFEQ